LTEEEQRNAIITTITLDVSNKHLKEVPKTIKNFSNIEFLYLSTNDIKGIPDHFFTSLPHLKWLDFRHNLLTSIPSSIGEHRQLRTLLLQGNQITRLPVELGNVPSLTGLNIADNPVEYPPKTVLQHGTHEILKYLRLELQSGSQLIPELIEAMEEVHVTENEGYLGSGEEEESRILAPIKKTSRRKNRTQEIESPLNNRKTLSAESIIWHRRNEQLSLVRSKTMMSRPSSSCVSFQDLSSCLLTVQSNIIDKDELCGNNLDRIKLESSSFQVNGWFPNTKVYRPDFMEGCFFKGSAQTIRQ